MVSASTARARTQIQSLLPSRPGSEGNPLLRASGFIVAFAFRVVPPRFRFRAAILFARWLEPFIAATRSYKARAKLKTDGLCETSLELLLMMLTRHRTTFDPVLHVEGIEHLPAAGSGPTLIVGPHTMLSTLFIRHLDDAGHDPVVITADPDQGIPGRRTRAHVLSPSPALLFKVRRCLEEGRTVAGMIDRGEPERRGSTVETSGGPVFVSDALLQLAIRHRARIVFIATKMDTMSRVVTRLSTPSHRNASVPEIVAAFAAFVEDVHHTPDLAIARHSQDERGARHLTS